MFTNIANRVDHLVRFYKTRDPFEMIKGMNVILVTYPLEGVRGFYQYFQRNNIIYLDENLSDQERRFVLAHELGHMMMHKSSNAIFMDTRTQFNTSKYEQEANLFAMELLLPDQMLNDYMQAGYSAEQLARVTGYCEGMIRLRLNKM